MSDSDTLSMFLTNEHHYNIIQYKAQKSQLCIKLFDLFCGFWLLCDQYVSLNMYTFDCVEQLVQHFVPIASFDVDANIAAKKKTLSSTNLQKMLNIMFIFMQSFTTFIISSCKKSSAFFSDPP